MSPHERDALLQVAREVRERAYAPYSGFAVGAAILSEGGTMSCGTNVESASYGLTMCAERNAVGSAVAAGRRDFVAIAIAGPAQMSTPPCGACCQVLAEFNPSMTVLYTSPEGVVVTTLKELLPHSFGTHV